MSTLADKECLECVGKVPTLTQKQKRNLRQEIHADWQLTHDSSRLYRDIKCQNFQHAMDTAVLVGQLAERVKHHPDIHVSWGRCGVEIWTHVINDLSENDFIFAAKVDQIIL